MTENTFKGTNKERLLAVQVLGTEARNRMGCNESWYNPDYAIQNTFSREEIEAMSELEVDNLLRLANMLSEVFY